MLPLNDSCDSAPTDNNSYSPIPYGTHPRTQDGLQPTPPKTQLPARSTHNLAVEMAGLKEQTPLSSRLHLIRFLHYSQKNVPLHYENRTLRPLDFHGFGPLVSLRP